MGFIKTEVSKPLVEGAAFAVGGDIDGDGKPEVTTRGLIVRSPRAWGYQVELNVGDVKLELSAEEGLALVTRLAKLIPSLLKNIIPGA